MDNTKEQVRIMFVGDINLGEYYMSFGHGPRTFAKSDNPFRMVESIFSKADFLVGNLEAPLTDHHLQDSEPEAMVLRGAPSSASLLSDAGFKILQLANNHTVQHGMPGFDETVKVLKSSEIFPVGLSDQPPVVMDLKGQKFGFLAASDVPDNTYKDQDKYQKVNNEFMNRIQSAVSQVDHLFVLLHWGLESATSPLGYQREFSEKLRGLGVRGVIGHHPHLFYEIFKENQMIFAPSLGDFVFDLGWDKRLLQSGILDITINKTNVFAQVWPVELKNNGCLPTPSGNPISITDSVNLYDLGTSMKGEQIRKVVYLLKNIHKGNTTLKLKFLSRKIQNRIFKI